MATPPTTPTTPTTPLDRPEKSLWRACERCNLPEVRRLLQAHPDLDVNWGNYECYDFTPLHIACTRGDPTIITELLHHPCIDVNRLDANDMSPFMLSCQVGRVKPLRALLPDHRVNLNLFTPRGSTGIWYASCFGKVQAVMAIIASGRDVNLQTKGKHYDGRMLTAAGIAQVNKQPDLAKLLADFEENQEKMRFEAKLSLGQRECLSSHLFALTVLYSDQYLALVAPSSTSSSSTATATEEAAAPQEEKAARFFRVITRLPLELQMIVCNRVFRLARDLISTKDSEPAFRYMVHTYH